MFILGSLLRDFGSVRVELNRDSLLHSTRVYDVEPFTDHWNRDLPYTNQASCSHIRLVSLDFEILVYLKIGFSNLY